VKEWTLLLLCSGPTCNEMACMLIIYVHLYECFAGPLTVMYAP